MTDPQLPVDECLLAESAAELYENAPCGFLSTFPDGTFLQVNQTFLVWTGYSREELVGRRRFQDLLTLGGRIFHETHLAPLLRMQGTVNEVALDLMVRDGTTLPVFINTSQKWDALGQPVLNLVTVFNATDRRQYERELLLARRKAEQAAEAKARLLALISHEIRTPLSTISLVTELLQSTSGEERQAKHLRTLKAASQHLAELVDDLLDYSKLEAGRMSLDRRNFSLGELTAEIIERLQPRAEAQHLGLRVELADGVPDRVCGDPLKLGQVLTNLVGNALKFTEQGGVVLGVGLAEQSPAGVVLEFRVQDTGIGIPNERLGDIFEEFTQASPDTAARFGGTGLGLTITRKLLHLMGSDIAVTSVVGAGSTFTFQVRLEEAFNTTE